MKMRKKAEKGFTVIEITVSIVVLMLLAGFFILQRSSLESIQRDQQRKTAVNAMYYALTEVYFVENKSYPQSISSENLKVIDPDLFMDPWNFILNGEKCNNRDGEVVETTFCDYKYSAVDCDSDGKCQGFTIKTYMENEEEYSRSSGK